MYDEDDTAVTVEIKGRDWKGFAALFLRRVIIGWIWTQKQYSTPEVDSIDVESE